MVKSSTSTQVLEGNNKIKGYVKLIRDDTEYHNIQEQLKKEATTDYLSNLFNRRHFISQCKSVLAKASLNEPISFLMIDIDQFKSINDKYGHSTGDQVIRTVGSLLSYSFKDESIVGRIGGEEFAVLLKGIDNESAFNMANAFRTALSDLSIPTESGSITTTASIGLSTYIDASCSLDIIMSEADKALYKAKESGRNMVVAR